jgi:hypothetical protein
MMSIPDIYKKDPYGDMLRNTIAYKNEQIKELEATLERVKKLPETWRVKADWLHDKGGSEQLSKADGFDKCADELEDELSGIQGKALDGESSKSDLVEKDSNVYEKSFVETYPTHTADYSPDKCCNVSHPLCFGTCTMQDACQQCNWNTPCAEKTSESEGKS